MSCLQCLFYFLLSRLQGLILTQVQITGILKREFFSHLPKHPFFIRTPFQIKLWGLSLTLSKWVIKKNCVTPQKCFYFPLNKTNLFPADLQLPQKQITIINRWDSYSATWLPLDSRISSALSCFFPLPCGSVSGGNHLIYQLQWVSAQPELRHCRLLSLWILTPIPREGISGVLGE